LNARHAATFDVDPRHFAVLDQVDAALIRPTGEAPRHGVVARGAAALVVEAAENREPRLFEIEIGNDLAHALCVQKDRVVALVDHGVSAPCIGVALAV
jgi:hypothetical protein